jgi:phosphoribosylformylglycinamidine synthase PurS subunit
MPAELPLKIPLKTTKNPLPYCETELKAKVFVTYRDGVLDPQGLTIYEVLKQHGHEAVRDIRVGKMIEIELDDMETEKARAMIEDISNKVLANPVTETFKVEL